MKLIKKLVIAVVIVFMAPLVIWLAGLMLCGLGVLWLEVVKSIMHGWRI
jgi:hypothetical protein